MNFNGFIKDITENKWKVYGVEVYENSVLTHACGDTTDCIHDIYSATKSVVSVAFGIAYDRGLIELDRTILDYLPGDKVAAMSEVQKESFLRITPRRLLTMSVDGFPFAPQGDKWLDYSLKCEIPNPDEKVFNYSGINTFLIGVALTEVLGCDLGGFITEEIFMPLNILDFELKYSPDDYFYGATGMKLCVHDLSKIGLLMCNGGVYDGKRIVSEEYVSLATSVQQMNREGGYGFFFWKYKDGFSINGKCKQRCFCFPNRKLTVSFLSYIDDDSRDLYDSAERNLLGTIN